MTQPAKAQEPSMEEILASIRRIIADDDATKSTPRGGEMPKAEPPPAAAAPPPAPPSQQPAFTPPPTTRPYIEPESDRPEAAVFGEMEDQSSDILELTESMAAPMPPRAPASPAPEFRTIDGASDVGFAEPMPYRPAPSAAADPAALVSSETSAAVDAAFNTLAQTVLAKNARTLEDLVREMLRPMLKTWLDDNLPGTVERLVRAEIERVSRGRPG
jgi:uncharacterized protein